MMNDVASRRPAADYRNPGDVLTRKRSREAADVAQYVLDLEDAIRDALAQAASAENRKELVEDANEVLLRQLAEARDEVQRLRAEITEIDTMLECAGTVIVDALNRRRRGERATPTASQAATAQLSAPAPEPKPAEEPETARQVDDVETDRMASIFGAKNRRPEPQE